MDCPRPQDFRAARHRLSQATAAWAPGILTIQGVEVCGSVRLGAETFDLGERGPVQVQTLEARLGKSLVPGEPRQGDIVTVEGRAFKITRVDGFMPDEVDWFLTGTRTPGRDS